MALDIIADETWDDVDKAWDAFTLETWDGWVEFSYALKIYDTSGDKVAEITGDLKNPTLTELEFETLQQGGCGAFKFTLAKPYTQATISYNYRVEVYIFNPQVLFFTGKIINKPVEGTDKPQTYSGWGYFNELEKKIIDTEISPGNDIAVEVTSVLDTYITPYTSILKDTDLIETVNHDLVATIDFEDEYAKDIFRRLTELAVDYKFGVNKDRKFFFQAIDTSINYYWHIGKHLSKFLPEEDPSDLVKKVIAVYPEVFTDGYRLKITSEAGDYAGLYDERFSLPEIVNPFSNTNIASGKSVSTSPTGTDASNITDGVYSTLWTSDTNQASGHYIIIDLGADFENIAAVEIDSIYSTAKEYSAKSIKIEVKPDGGSYATMLSSSQDIGWKPYLTFRPTTGRYVKISLIGSSSEEWKVGQVKIFQLDLTDAQRWADWKLTTLENVKKRATARIDNIQDLIMNSTGLVPIKPVGKARIFDRDGTKIDDYQVIACTYSLSSGGFSLDLELGAEKLSIADTDKEWQRRIRELENSGVRRAKNLSLSKGFQLSQIKGTYIGENEIQTKQLAANSILTGQLSVVGIDDNGQLVLGEIGSGDFDDLPDSVTYVKAEMQAAYDGTVKYRSTGAPTNNPTPTTISKLIKANGSMDIRLGWDTYTQGVKQADLILLFWVKSTEAADKIWDEIEETWNELDETWDGTSLGAPVVTDSCVTFNVNTSAGSYYIMEGVNPNSVWSFGIAAARRTENGLEIGAIQSSTSTPDWQDVTSDSPNYVGNIHGVPAVNIRNWGEPSGSYTYIKGGMIYTGSITALQIAASTITADKLNVTQLDAISADIGTLTVGTITTGISINGNWRKIYDETIAGSAVNSFVVPDLDGNTDIEYIIRVRWVSGGGTPSDIDFMMRPNADAGANYGVENYGAENPNAPFSFHGEAETGFWVGWVKRNGELSQGIAHLYAKSGYERTCISLITCQVSGKDVGAGVTSHGSWNNTGANITSLTFADLISDTGIGVGSRTEIWKRVA